MSSDNHLRKIFHKSRVYPLVLILVVFLVWKYRESNKPSLVTITGTTMGPIQYTVKYVSDDKENYKPGIDSLLERFNQSLNHYRPDSEVSRFNRDSVFVFESPFFLDVLEKSREVYERSAGAFDPTVGPLVNAWGFGPGQKQNPDSTSVDSLLQIIYFHNLDFNENQVWKKKKGIQLDFSAIAKGQGVDIVCEYLASKGLENIFVEIGGEVRCIGNNENGNPWKIGILDPVDPTNPFGSVELDNRSMATSGNYFNFIEERGRRIVHTISPLDGFPVVSNLLSASVVASDCMTADAYATAFMVMGLERSIELSKEISGLDVFFIFSQPDGTLEYYTSSGIENQFTKIKSPNDP